MNRDEQVIRVLAADCREVGSSDEVEITNVDSAGAVMIALRYETFDLLITTCDIAGLAVWPLAQKVRRVRPKLHWWLVAHGITNDQEILARTLGVTRILARVPTADFIAAGLIRRGVPLIERPLEPLRAVAH